MDRAYWNAPASRPTDPAHAFDMDIGHVGDDIRAIFRTEGGQPLIGSLPPARATASWRADPVGTLVSDLSSDSVTDPPVAGPGRALVGDAGHHRDFVLGDGITEALLQARSLAAAIDEGSEAARTASGIRPLPRSPSRSKIGPVTPGFRFAHAPPRHGRALPCEVERTP